MKILKFMFRLLCWAAGIAALVGIASLVRSEFRRQREATASQEARAEKAVPVHVERVKLDDLRREVTLSGHIECEREAKVVSKVVGRLEVLKVAECDVVKRGDVIAVVDHDALDAQVERDRAALAVAEAGLYQARVALEVSAREKTRMENLLKGGAANERAADKARAAHALAEAAKALADAGVRQAEAELRQAEVDAEEATIKAPFDGVVCQKLLDVGNLVGPQAPIVSIVAVQTVRAFVDVSETYIRHVTPGETAVEVATDAYPGSKFSGSVHRIHTRLDRRTRTAKVEVKVPNEDRLLKPGMFARVTLVIEERRGVPVVPAPALVREGDRSYVFVLSSNVAQKRRVKLGMWAGAKVEVCEGLKTGDRLVVRGQHDLVDGTQVEVVGEGDA